MILVEAMENSQKVRWVGSMAKMKCKVRNLGWYCMMKGLVFSRDFGGGDGDDDDGDGYIIQHHYLHGSVNCLCRI